MKRTLIPLLTLIALLATTAAAFAGSGVDRRYVTPKGKIGAGAAIGFTTYGKKFGKDGRDDVGSDNSTYLPIVLDARYGIIDGLDAGIQFSLANVGSGGESKFGARELLIGAAYQLSLNEMSTLLFGLDFKADIGSKASGGKPATSDRQHGLKADVRYNHNFGSFVLTAGLRWIIPFERDSVKNGMTFDPNVGVIFGLTPKLVLGIDLGFAFITSGDQGKGSTTAGQGAAEDDSSYVFYVAPWIKYFVADSHGIYLALATMNEDFTVGLPLAGKNFSPGDWIPGFTLGWQGTF